MTPRRHGRTVTDVISLVPVEVFTEHRPRGVPNVEHVNDALVDGEEDSMVAADQLPDRNIKEVGFWRKWASLRQFRKRNARALNSAQPLVRRSWRLLGKPVKGLSNSRLSLRLKHDAVFHVCVSPRLRFRMSANASAAVRPLPWRTDSSPRRTPSMASARSSASRSA